MAYSFGSGAVLNEAEAQGLQVPLKYVTDNAQVEALAVISVEGYLVAFTALPDYNVDGDTLAGIAASILEMGRMTVAQTFHDPGGVETVIIRGALGYMIIVPAGRFFLIGASKDINYLIYSTKVFSEAGNYIAQIFPSTRPE